MWIEGMVWYGTVYRRTKKKGKGVIGSNSSIANKKDESSPLIHAWVNWFFSSPST